MYSCNKQPVMVGNHNDRQFIFPFLVGALTGGAAIGLTRPLPIYNVAPTYGYPYYGPYNYGYNPYNPYYPYYR